MSSNMSKHTGRQTACTGKWLINSDITCHTLPQLFNPTSSLPNHFLRTITFDPPQSMPHKQIRLSPATQQSTARQSTDMLMACSNANQYILQLSSKPLPPLLSTLPKLAPASLTVHSIIQAGLANEKEMPPDSFTQFLHTSLEECHKTDPDMVIYETYILFLFTQILREIITHLAIPTNSPYFSIFDQFQTHLIIGISRLNGPPPPNFGYHLPLPNAENWAPVNEPSRTRTWIVWPDVPDGTAKQYSQEGWTHMGSIP